MVIKNKMKVKSILVSQPQPKESSPYHELGKRNKIKIDFRQFIHVEGVSAKDVELDFAKIYESTRKLKE